MLKGGRGKEWQWVTFILRFYWRLAVVRELHNVAFDHHGLRVRSDWRREDLARRSPGQTLPKAKSTITKQTTRRAILAGSAAVSVATLAALTLSSGIGCAAGLPFLGRRTCKVAARSNSTCHRCRQSAGQAHRRARRIPVQGPRAHATARLRLCAGERRARHASNSGLARPSRHPAHCPLH